MCAVGEMVKLYSDSECTLTNMYDITGDDNVW